MAVYRGKVDWWIGAAIAFGLLFPVYASLTKGPLWVIVLPVLFAALLFGCLFPQRFEIAEDALVVRAGFTTRRIPWSSLTCVKPTSDATSALAMSLDRVLIEYGNGSLMIAPDRQEEFFRDVAEHAPQLTRRGQDLSVAFR